MPPGRQAALPLSNPLARHFTLMSQLPNPDEYRKPDHPINRLFVRRWSPRAMSGESLSEEELLTLARR